MNSILKPILAFIAVNLSIIIGLTILFYILDLFGIHISAYHNLFLYSLMVGFFISFASLFISK